MARISISSPLGPLALREEGGAIVALTWEPAGGAPPRDGGGEATPLLTTPLLTTARRQLEAYFGGGRRAFDLALAPRGSAFQRAVWRILQEIPAGDTATYGAIAGRLKTAPRAVGMACARNPIPILIPCHRVVAAGGRPGGYSAPGGVAAKSFLLRLEGTVFLERALERAL